MWRRDLEQRRVKALMKWCVQAGRLLWVALPNPPDGSLLILQALNLDVQPKLLLKSLCAPPFFISLWMHITNMIWAEAKDCIPDGTSGQILKDNRPILCRMKEPNYQLWMDCDAIRQSRADAREASSCESLMNGKCLSIKVNRIVQCTLDYLRRGRPS